MLSNPKITVLMPVYNCELYIREAVDSILNQTFADFEFLILDDASTDATVAIIKTYNDPRIQLIQKPQNSGYTNSLNNGLSIAKGEYIARMDGDDISLPERFAKQVAFMDANPEVVVCGCAFQILGSDKISSGCEFNDDIKLAMLKESCIGHPTAMIRKSILEKNNILYDNKMEPAEDYDLWVRLLSFGKLHNLQEILLYYRNHEQQISVTKKEKQRSKANVSRFNMVNYLGYSFTDEEKRIYQKVFSHTEKFDFDEVNVFFKVKEALINQNINGFYRYDDFLNFLNELEQKIMSQYFIGGKKFSPTIFIQYLVLKSKSNYRLNFVDWSKLLIKSILFYKTK
jgi:glycosyltransferase involved in cell wall biosynthesis